MKQNTGKSKFRVKCNFISGETIVEHDRPGFVDITPSTFNLSIEYKASMDHIKTLIQTSKECSQSIDFKCILSEITNFASWIDAQGIHKKFFTNPDRNICDCSLNSTCFSQNNLKETFCSCDYKDVNEHNDTITIRDKESLPLKSFLYQHMGSLPHWASVRLGPLVCSGNLRKKKPQVIKTCQDVRDNGDVSGYYVVKPKYEFQLP